MKTKIITGVILITAIAAGTLVYADSQSGTGVLSWIQNRIGNYMNFGGWRGGMMGGGFEGREWRGGWMMNFEEGEFRGMGLGGGKLTQLTEDEKTKLATMTDAEKQTFFEAKIIEQKALRDAKEAVIDKLINGETLSDTEKVTLETIKTERAAAKAERATREAKVAELQPIMAKIKAGQTLTADEQAKLYAARADFQKGWIGRWGMMGR